MNRILDALGPAVEAREATLRALRPHSVKLLLAVASLAAAGAGAIAFFAGPAGAIQTFAGGYVLLDATTRLFLLVVNLVFVGVATYLWTRVRDTPELQVGIGRLVGQTLLFMAAADAAILSGHLIATWVLIELTTLAAIPMVQHRGSLIRLRASWTYFLFSTVGLGLALLGFACLARGMESTGAPTFFLDGLAEAARQPSDVWRRLGLILILLGFGTKLGLAPMHVWLPDTYQAAPPAVTVLLAAVQFNVVLGAVFRVVQLYRATDHELIATELVALGLLTMAVSAFGIIATRSSTRLIAYAALNHGGVIAIGLGIGKVAAYGVVLYAVSNAFIKAILFLTAGKIEAHYKTDDVRKVSGLLKDMPYSGLFFMVGIFALLGFPPFGSFLGELIVMSGLLGQGHLAVFAAFCSILTVTFIATGRAVFPMIWGEPRKQVDWQGQPLAMMLPKLTFLAALLAMGLYLPAPVNALFRQVAAGLGAR